MKRFQIKTSDLDVPKVVRREFDQRMRVFFGEVTNAFMGEFGRPGEPPRRFELPIGHLGLSKATIDTINERIAVAYADIRAERLAIWHKDHTADAAQSAGGSQTVHVDLGQVAGKLAGSLLGRLFGGR